MEDKIAVKLGGTWIVDGSIGEGGGQIVRTALSIVAINGVKLEIRNIRAGRPKPGLKPQHVAAIRLMAAMSNAAVDGNVSGSDCVRFRPYKGLVDQAYSESIETEDHRASAGAVSLVLQTVMPALARIAPLLSKVTVRVDGGTHVAMAPTVDYLEEIYWPALRACGVGLISQHVHKAGYMPAGGGSVDVSMNATGKLTAVCRPERGRLAALHCRITCSNLPDHVVERGKAAALAELAGYGIPVGIEISQPPADTPGAACFVYAEFASGTVGWSSLGARGVPMERVVREAVRAFKKWFATGASVDNYLADQLVLPAALCRERSEWTVAEPSLHLKTVLNLVRDMLGAEYSIEQQSDGNWRVQVQGTQ